MAPVPNFTTANLRDGPWHPLYTSRVDLVDPDITELYCIEYNLEEAI